MLLCRADLECTEHYFEMSRPDAERAINIYRNFTRQTDLVVQYLAIARQFEHVTRFQIPKIKHAPTSLSSSLEEYLNDKDFEINRRQYLAGQDARKRSGKGGSTNGIKAFTEKTATPSQSAPAQKFPSPTKETATPATKGPAPDLIDFFESIEQNQQPLGQPNNAPFAVPAQQFPQQGFASQPTGFISQPTGFPQQQQQQAQQQQPFATGAGQSTNPFGQVQQPQQQPAPLQTNFTGAGFGGYTPQPQQSFSSSLQSIPQDGVANFSPQQQQPMQTGSTNPFRLSMMPTGASNTSFGSGTPMSPVSNPNRMSTNPFARNSPSAATPFSPPNGQQQQQQPTGGSQQPFQPQSQFGQQQQQQNQQSSSPFALQPQATGTNPFARNTPTNGASQGGPIASPLSANVTGSTNPFRQSAFVNQSTGQGWQNVPQNQGTIGGMGLGGVETTSIFPRPGAA